MQLVVEVYRLSAALSRDERFGLTAQVRRAVLAVPTNIAEGRQRLGAREFRHFVSIARGSVAEVETLLDIGLRLGFLTQAAAVEANTLCEQVSRMLMRLQQRLGDAG